MEDTELVDEEPRGGIAWIELLFTIVVTLALVVLIRLFVAETYEIPTGSMLETIQLGDRVVGEKVSLYWEEPKPGDIVFFDDPDGSGSTLVKRVVATAGQVVDLQYGEVYIDGEKFDEPYTLGKPSYPLDSHAINLEDNVTFPYTVPENCVWVMGDNRTNSLDSRYFGSVPVKAIKSRALFTYWPIKDVGTFS